VDAQPAQSLFKLLQRFGRVAFKIGVFDAQNELPAGLPGEQIVKDVMALKAKYEKEYK
jgi:hypothetical protein